MKKKPTLKSVLRQFKYWRRKRKHRDAIPERLWTAAVTLTKEHTLNKVAKTLKLNHTALRDKVNEALSSANSSKTSVPDFVELDLQGTLFPKPQRSYEIEVTDGRGWKIKLCAGSNPELIAIARQVWRGEF